MATFTDLKGNDRAVSITVRHLRPLRERCGIKFDELVRQDKLLELVTDPERLTDALFVLCGRTDESAEDFADTMDLPAVERAAGAFLEAVACFCRGPKAGAAVAANLQPRIAELVAKAEANIDLLTSSDSPGNSPGSSA